MKMSFLGRCEIYLVAGDSKHRVSTGPLAPILDQLATAKEQFSPDTSEIVLEPRPLTTALSRSPGSWKSSIFKRSKSDKKKGWKGKKQSLDGGEAPAWFTKATAEKYVLYGQTISAALYSCLMTRYCASSGLL